MKEKTLYGIWAGLFILCAGLGFIPSPTGVGRGVLVLIALAFFVPGAMILYRAMKRKNRKGICLVRNLAIVSLTITMAVIIANFLAVNASDAAGWALHILLILVSTPMFCGQYWILSLFLWACLLVSSISGLKKLKK